MHPRLLPFSVLCLLAGAAEICAAEGEFEVNLTGITHFNDRSLALLEITGPSPRTLVIKPILAEGERIGKVEVRKIDARAGFVRIANDGIESTYPLDGKAGEVKRTFNLKDADSVQVLDIYQQLSGRTVLRSAGMPTVKFSLKTDDLAKADAERFLEEAFLAKGIVIELRAEKFALAVRAGQVERLSRIPEPPVAPTAPIDRKPGTANLGKSLPPGLIKFHEADPFQALEIYQELSGRTVLAPSNLRGGKVSLRTQSQLTRAEAVWVLDAALALAEVTMLPQGEKFVFALAGAGNAQVPGINPNPATANPRSSESLPAGMIKFQSTASPQVLAVYAEIAGREVTGEEPPQARFTIRNQTALTRAEVLFALDALAAINQVRFVFVGDNQVKLVPVALARRDAP